MLGDALQSSNNLVRLEAPPPFASGHLSKDAKFQQGEDTGIGRLR